MKTRAINFMVVIFVFTALFVNVSVAQNVGQKDTIVKNYTDINGQKQGYWKKRYKNGNTAYEANFRNDKLVGTYKRYYENNQLFALINYSMELPDSLADVTYYWDDGKLLAEGHFIQQKLKQGLWRYYNVNGEKIGEFNYLNDTLDGVKKIFYADGTPSYQVTYKDGVKDGVETKYYDNGKKESEQQIKKGKFQGKLYVYYPSGNFRLMGAYKNNLKDGKWTFYTSSGKIERTIIYNKGIAENQDEIDEEFTKQVEEWEKMKGKIKEPSEEDFFKKKDKEKQDWENSN